MSARLDVRALREAGHVTRGHNLRHIGHYDVAQHSWHATVLLYALHPDPSPALVKAVMFHDVGERYVGDLPAPAKWASAELAKVHGELEDRALAQLGVTIDLPPEDQRWLKAVDLLELFLWCEDQLALGNRHVYRCHEAVQLWFATNRANLPAVVADVVEQFTWERTNEQLS